MRMRSIAYILSRQTPSLWNMTWFDRLVAGDRRRAGRMSKYILDLKKICSGSVDRSNGRPYLNEVPVSCYGFGAQS